MGANSGGWNEFPLRVLQLFENPSPALVAAVQAIASGGSFSPSVAAGPTGSVASDTQFTGIEGNPEDIPGLAFTDAALPGGWNSGFLLVFGQVCIGTQAGGFNGAGVWADEDSAGYVEINANQGGGGRATGLNNPTGNSPPSITPNLTYPLTYKSGTVVAPATKSLKFGWSVDNVNQQYVNAGSQFFSVWVRQS